MECPMKQKSISVFLPALNEQENIKTSIYSVKEYLDKRFKDYEIIVVSNGSTDSTVRIVRELAKKDKHIMLINDKKLGYGTALRSGFAHSSKELIFYTDADNQFDIEDLDNLFPLLSSYDIVSGYRVKRQDPLMRIFVAWAYNMLIRILFNLKVRDIDASFKLYKKKVFENMILKASTGLIDVEVLIKAKKNGFSIGQIAVRHYPRMKGQTSYEIGKRNKIFAFVKPKVIMDIIKEIINLWSDLR